jgi:AraC family transcriptional regulator of adaptative response/methylated-DNA-[protein]-cysteine methyltransferase
MKVWEALLKIPANTLVSYKTIAHLVGSSKAVRAVGTAVGHNPIGYLIPCHRVIRETGHLGGYACGLNRKQAILAMEALQSL